MKFEEDEILQECLKSELDKIPSFFRCGKKRFRIFVIIIAIWLVIDLCLGFYKWKDPEIIWIRNMYVNYPFAVPGSELKVFVVMNIIILLLLLWLEIVTLLEKRAMSKASIEAARIAQYRKEQESIANIREIQKLKKISEHMEQEEIKSKPAPRYCSKCGFLMPEDINEKKCQTCGHINE